MVKLRFRHWALISAFSLLIAGSFLFTSHEVHEHELRNRISTLLVGLAGVGFVLAFLAYGKELVKELVKPGGQGEKGADRADKDHEAAGH
jgi:hypothetical protein